MSVDELALEVRRLAALVERLVAQQAPALTPQQRAVLRSAVALYPAAEVFTASSMLDAAGLEREHREVLRRACGDEPHRLGILLGQLADAGAVLDGMRLVRLPREAGARRWALEGIEPL